MLEVKAPERRWSAPRPWVFVAGSIEMGAAENWQTRLVASLTDMRGTLWNPRRDNWDASWEQRESNPKFSEQVNWELDHLETADKIVLYFDPATKSPITLLELGLHAASKKLVVCCPDGFWRKGNVEIVCTRYGIPLMRSFEHLVERIKGAR